MVIEGPDATSCVSIKTVNFVEASLLQKCVKNVMMVIILVRRITVHYIVHQTVNHVFQAKPAPSARKVFITKITHVSTHIVLSTVIVQQSQVIAYHAKRDTITRQTHAKTNVR